MIVPDDQYEVILELLRSIPNSLDGAVDALELVTELTTHVNVALSLRQPIQPHYVLEAEEELLRSILLITDILAVFRALREAAALNNVVEV